MNNEENKISYEDTIHHVPHLIGGLLVVSIVLLGGLVFLSRQTPYEQEVPEAVATTSTPFDSIYLEAQSAYVYDVKNDYALFEKNAHTALPLASVTKILSVLVAKESFDERSIITITGEDLAEEGDSGLYLGERWQRDDLLKYILVTSSNDGIAALVRTNDARGASTFVEKMNEKANILDLSSFVIQNATGLDFEPEEIAANYGSAKDVATLFASALKDIPDTLDATRTGQKTISSLDHVHAIENTNTIIDSIPNAVGSKTGFTDVAGGNLAISFDVGIGRPIIIVVLGSSREGRFQDVATLVDATLKWDNSH